jgi:hypothetical protein
MVKDSQQLVKDGQQLIKDSQQQLMVKEKLKPGQR